MAEPLKNFFSRNVVRRLADDIVSSYPRFPKQAFVRRATKGLEDLELLDRGRHISNALAACLPPAYPEAIEIILGSLGPAYETDEVSSVGMTPFYYLPHVTFVAERGLDHFDLSMKAQYELTKRFTAESSIRPYIEQYPDRTMAVLSKWTRDSDAHVRRLVSEGTRLRLPWAPRVPWLDDNPERILELLEVLKDDPSTYVRRSVANNLNDLGKIYPDLLIKTCKKWSRSASGERKALVEHALRSAIKRADPKALKLLGYGDTASVKLEQIKFEPKRVKIGGRTNVGLVLRSSSSKKQDVLVDLIVHFVKASGNTSPKVFKLGRATLLPREAKEFRKAISLAVHSTRKPYPGKHLVEAQVNGKAKRIGTFEVVS
jgi:3-methyladenine DNA glycosylase AlkC